MPNKMITFGERISGDEVVDANPADVMSDDQAREYFRKHGRVVTAIAYPQLDGSVTMLVNMEPNPMLDAPTHAPEMPPELPHTTPSPS
jgi:hypothetical protein